MFRHRTDRADLPWPPSRTPEALDEIVELAVEATDASHASIYLPGRRGLRPAATAGAPASTTPEVVDRELAEASLRSGTLLATAPGRTASRADHPLARAAALPLWHAGRRHGALTVCWAEPGAEMSGRRHETLTALAIAAERVLEDNARDHGQDRPRFVHLAPETPRVRTLE